LALCSKCSKRDKCRKLCKAVEKEITGRGITASQKGKTYSVDFTHIEDTRQPLNPFQIDVLHVIVNLSSGKNEQLITKYILQKAVEKVLSDREKQLFELFREEYNQEHIANILRVSQPRVNYLLNRIREKLRNFLRGGYKIS